MSLIPDASNGLRKTVRAHSAAKFARVIFLLPTE
jgi:hypothetical protein